MRRENMDQTKPETAYVRQLALGPMKNFVYLVGAPGGREAFVIDPAWDVPAIVAAAAEDGREVSAIVLTHHHHDHINGVPELLTKKHVPLYVQRAEMDFAASLKPFEKAARTVEPGERVTIAGLEVECLHTPGHTPGAQCLHCGGAVFTGDTLFVNACGRCDFAGSDPVKMFESLHQTLGALSGETAVYPGHDYGDVKVSSMARERERNPYLQLKEREAFVKYRMTPR
jgi:glyoxylase-like metal-dependent hydrolase (beta-lactamase superfamily II)